MSKLPWPEIVTALWFFLPAGVANSIPIPVSKIPFLKKFNQPLDMGLNYKGVRIFGDHKTWRGLISGIIASIVVVFIQKSYLEGYSALNHILKIDYSIVDPYVLGFTLGFGALLGDMVKSFFKRRVGVKPGKAWFPFDQIDYIVGGVLLSLVYVQLPIGIYFWIFIFWFLLHPIFTFLGWVVKLKDSPI